MDSKDPIQTNNPSKTLIKAGITLSVHSSFSTVLGFLSGMIIAAAFGPYQRGVYQAWRTFNNLISDFTNLGLGRFLSSRISIQNLNLRGIKWHMGTGFLIGIILVPVMIHLNFPSWIIILTIIQIPVGIWIDIYMGLLIRHERYLQIARWGVISVAGPSVFTIALFFLQLLNLVTVITATILCSAIGLLYGHNFTKIPNGVESIYSKFRLFIPIYFSNILRSIFLFLDQLLVLLFINLNQLGIFSVALSVTSISTIITSSLNNLVPSIAKRGDKHLKSFFSKTLIGYISLAIAGTIFSISILPWVITNTIGVEYLGSAKLVPLLLAGGLVQSGVQLMSTFSSFMNDSRTLLVEKAIHITSTIIAILVFLSIRNIAAAASFQLITSLPSLAFMSLKTIVTIRDLRDHVDKPGNGG